MSKIGQILIFIARLILFVVIGILMIMAALFLAINFIYALTLIGIPKAVAQLIFMMLCLFMVIGR